MPVCLICDYPDFVWKAALCQSGEEVARRMDGQGHLHPQVDDIVYCRDRDGGQWQGRVNSVDPQTVLVHCQDHDLALPYEGGSSRVSKALLEKIDLLEELLYGLRKVVASPPSPPSGMVVAFIMGVSKNQFSDLTLPRPGQYVVVPEKMVANQRIIEGVGFPVVSVAEQGMHIYVFAGAGSRRWSLGRGYGDSPEEALQAHELFPGEWEE